MGTLYAPHVFLAGIRFPDYPPASYGAASPKPPIHPLSGHTVKPHGPMESDWTRALSIPPLHLARTGVPLILHVWQALALEPGNLQRTGGMLPSTPSLAPFANRAFAMWGKREDGPMGGL